MDAAVFASLRLAKEGFGTPEQIMEMGTDTVLAALEYSTFLGDYEETMIELNRETKK